MLLDSGVMQYQDFVSMVIILGFIANAYWPCAERFCGEVVCQPAAMSIHHNCVETDSLCTKTKTRIAIHSNTAPVPRIFSSACDYFSHHAHCWCKVLTVALVILR